MGVSHCEQIRCAVAQATIRWGRHANTSQHNQVVLAAQALGNMGLACQVDAEDVLERLNAAIRDPREKVHLFGVEVGFTKRVPDMHWLILREPHDPITIQFRTLDAP